MVWNAAVGGFQLDRHELAEVERVLTEYERGLSRWSASPVPAVKAEEARELAAKVRASGVLVWAPGDVAVLGDAIASMEQNTPAAVAVFRAVRDARKFDEFAMQAPEDALLLGVNDFDPVHSTAERAWEAERMAAELRRRRDYAGWTGNPADHGVLAPFGLDAVRGMGGDLDELTRSPGFAALVQQEGALRGYARIDAEQLRRDVLTAAGYPREVIDRAQIIRLSSEASIDSRIEATLARKAQSMVPPAAPPAVQTAVETELDHLEFSERVAQLRSSNRIDERAERELRKVVEGSVDVREFRARFSYVGPQLLGATEYRYLVSTLETSEGQRPQTWAESEAYVRAFGIDQYQPAMSAQRHEQDQQLRVESPAM